MEEETIYLTCQSCGSIHTISDAGELELVEDKREGAKGINGIRVHTVGGETWAQDKYIASEPRQYQPPVQMLAGKAGRQSHPVEQNPELMEAHKKDLKERNIH